MVILGSWLRLFDGIGEKGQQVMPSLERLHHEEVVILTTIDGATYSERC